MRLAGIFRCREQILRRQLINSELEKEDTMKNCFVIKGNLCQTKHAKELDLHEHAFAVCVDGISKGIFDVLPEEYASLPL